MQGLLISNIAIAGDTIADTFRLSLEVSAILSKISVEYRYRWQNLPISIPILYFL